MGQRRVLGKGGQVRPPGDAPLGVGAVEDPVSQRLGGGLRVAQEFGGDACVPPAFPQRGGLPYLGVGVGSRTTPSGSMATELSATCVTRTAATGTASTMS
ncbi:hypothetical protein AB0R12_10305, partial [Streptomyces niveus]|uniref:hypothetical protein n=1 Tax=Streptomyces niveus TaxID=193462 RepID=UPI00342F6773